MNEPLRKGLTPLQVANALEKLRTEGLLDGCVFMTEITRPENLALGVDHALFYVMTITDFPGENYITLYNNPNVRLPYGERVIAQSEI